MQQVHQSVGCTCLERSRIDVQERAGFVVARRHGTGELQFKHVDAGIRRIAALRCARTRPPGTRILTLAYDSAADYLGELADS